LTNFSDVPIKDKNGRLLTTENEQKARWAEHYKQILNRLAPDEEAIVIEAVRDLEINTSVPDKQEIVTTSPSCLSIASVILWIIIFAMILLGIGKRVIPRQLLQSLRAPILANFIIMPLVQ
jgi:hypothetical protein